MIKRWFQCYEGNPIGSGEIRGSALLPLLLAAILMAGCQSEPPAQQILRDATRELEGGNLSRAVEQIERGSTIAEDPGLRGRFELLKSQALVESGRLDEALTLLGSSPSEESAPFEVKRRLLQAEIFLRLQKPDSARSALELLDKDWQRPSEVEWLRRCLEARISAATHRAAQAESQFLRALSLAKQSSPQAEGEVLWHLGKFQSRLFRCAAAEWWLKEAQQIAGRQRLFQLEARAKAERGACRIRLNGLEEGLELRSQALDFWRQSERTGNLCSALGESGDLLVVAERPRQAVAFYRQAVQVANREGFRRQAALWTARLAAVMVQLDEFETADLLLQRLEQPDASSEMEDEIAWVKSLAAKAQVSEAQGKKSGPGLGKTGLGALPWGLKRNRTLDALHGLQRLRIGQLMQSGLEWKALQAAEEVRHSLQFMEGDFQITPEPPRLSPKRVILYFWTAPERSFLWMLSAAGLESWELQGSEEMAALSAAHQRGVQEHRFSPLSDGSTSGSRLYEILLAGAAPRISAESLVTIVADGPLHGLNFETLLTHNNPPRYWIEDVTLSVSPSLKQALQATPEAKTPLGEALLIGSALNPSPEGVRREIDRIERRLSKLSISILDGGRLNRDSLLNALHQGPSLVHSTACVEPNPESPFDSALLLSGDGRPDLGRLYARDWLNGRSAPAIVVFSCGRGAEEGRILPLPFVGFPTAALGGGSRAIVYPHWSIPERAATELLDRFYQQLSQGLDPIRALRQAKLSLIQSSSSLNRPYYWAAFQLWLGGPAEGQ